MKFTKKNDTEFAHFKRFMAKTDYQLKKDAANLKRWKKNNKELSEQAGEYETMQDNLKEKNK